MGYEPEFKYQGEYSPKDLIAGDFPLKTETISIELGQFLSRGAVLGKKTAFGKYVLSSKLGLDDKEVKDGSEKPLRILAEDIDTTLTEKLSIAYLTGSFFRDGLNLGKGHTIETIKPDLELRSIFIEG